MRSGGWGAFRALGRGPAPRGRRPAPRGRRGEGVGSSIVLDSAGTPVANDARSPWPSGLE